MSAERKYWFAYSVAKEQWLIMDWGRWSYPVNWRGSVFTLVMILLPIVILLASLDYISLWSEWALAAFVLVVAGGSTVIGVLIMRSLTDPKLTIEDYRAAKARNRATEVRLAELSPLDAMALARRLMWEPPLHDDYPGVIPEGAWPTWRRFESFARQEIAWRRVDGTVWRAARQAEDAPVFEADVGGDYLALTQEDWSGFPDPPEWGLHVATADGFEHLGNFDTWPEGWKQS